MGLWLEAMLDAVVGRLEKWAAWITRPFIVTPILVLIAILIACPDYRHFGAYAQTPWAQRALVWKSAHPLSSIPVEQFAVDAGPQDGGVIEHLRKRTYRITVPLIAKLTGLGLRGLDVLQQLTSCIFLLTVFLLFDGIFKDRIAALLGSVAMAASFVGQWGFNDFTYFDGFGYLLLLLTLWIKRPTMIPILVVAAGFIDERAILATPIIYLFQGDSAAGLGTRRTLAPNRLRAGTILGVTFFLVLRVVLGFHIGAMGDRSGIITSLPLRYNAIVLPLALLLLTKGLSVLIGASALVLANRKASRYALLLVSSVIPCVLAGVMVYDLSRSLGYAFPCIFICARIAAQNMGITSLRRIVLCAATLSVSMPTYYILLGLHPMLPIFRLL